MKATRRGFLAAIGIGTAVAHAAPTITPAPEISRENGKSQSPADVSAPSTLESIALHGITRIDQDAGYLTVEGDWRLGGPGLESSFTRRTFRRFVIIPASDFAPDLVFEGVPLSWNTAASHDGVVSNTIKFFLSKPPTQITLAEYF